MMEEAKRAAALTRYCGNSHDGSACLKCPYDSLDSENDPCVNQLFRKNADLIEFLADELERVEHERDAVAKKLERMKVIHIHNEYPEHDWKRDRDGEIDTYAMESEYHNGPICLRCHHSFCVFCNSYEENKGPCVTDEYKCPSCGHELSHNPSYNFCFHCGQALDWSE